MIVPPPIQDRIDAIRGNRTSGAAELTAQAADVLSLAASGPGAAAREMGRHFRVICTESRPLCEGAADVYAVRF